MVEAETDPLGRVTTHQHDALFRRVKTTLPAVTEVADPGSTDPDPTLTTKDDYEVKYYFGENSGSGAFTFGGFNPTRVVSARGQATDTQYDTAYRTTTVVRRADGWSSLASTAPPRTGELATVTAYNAASKPVVVTVRNEDRAGAAADRATYTFYDDRHRPTVTALDLAGAPGVGTPAGTWVNDATVFSADPPDIVTRTVYDAAGNATAVTDAEGRTTRTTYDGAGRVLRVRQPMVVAVRADGTTFIENYTPQTWTYYDADSNPVLTLAPDRIRTATEYDARNRPVRTTLDLNHDGAFDPAHGPAAADIVTRTGYDLQGNPVYGIDPNGNRTDTAYDNADRPTTVTGAAVADADDGDTLKRPVTTTAYDRAGKVLSVTDPRGVVTETEYDQWGRARTVTANATAPAGAADRLVTESRYDAAGNAVAVVLHNRVAGVDRPQVTTYVFDAFDRQTTETLPGVGDGVVRQSTTVYSRAGDALTATDPKGQLLEVDYDRAGRATASRHKRADGSVEETRASTYDRVGNLLRRTDSNGVSEYQYDRLNRLVIEGRLTTLAGGATDTYQIQSFYDAAGNRAKVQYPDAAGGLNPGARALVSRYDRAGRMVRLDDAGFSPARVTTFGYDAAGNRLTHLAPNGLLSTAAFDAQNRVTSMSTVHGSWLGATVYSLGYKYDRAGNRRSAGEALAGTGTRAIAWGYDGLYRLTGESWTGPSARTYAYTYDPAGNRLTRSDDAAVATGGSAERTDYQYDDLNRLVEWQSFYVGDVVQYEYDLNGNRTVARAYPNDGPNSTTAYSYDASDRLIAAATDGTAVFAGAYDARTRRLGKTENGQTTLFRYDGGTNFQELQGGQTVAELVRAGGLGGGIGSVLYSDRSMAPTAGPVEHFVYNAVGHTVALTDDAGTVHPGHAVRGVRRGRQPVGQRQREQPPSEHEGAGRQHRAGQPRVPVLRPGGRPVPDPGPARVRGRAERIRPRGQQPGQPGGPPRPKRRGPCAGRGGGGRRRVQGHLRVRA